MLHVLLTLWCISKKTTTKTMNKTKRPEKKTLETACHSGQYPKLLTAQDQKSSNLEIESKFPYWLSIWEQFGLFVKPARTSTLLSVIIMFRSDVNRYFVEIFRCKLCELTCNYSF